MMKFSFKYGLSLLIICVMTYVIFMLNLTITKHGESPPGQKLGEQNGLVRANAVPVKSSSEQQSSTSTAAGGLVDPVQPAVIDPSVAILKKELKQSQQKFQQLDSKLQSTQLQLSKTQQLLTKQQSLPPPPAVQVPLIVPPSPVTNNMKWLVIGMNTIARKNHEDYLTQTLNEMARQLPSDPTDLLYGQVLVIVMNMDRRDQGKSHQVYNQEKAKYGPGHPKVVSEYFVTRYIYNIVNCCNFTAGGIF